MARDLAITVTMETAQAEAGLKRVDAGLSKLSTTATATDLGVGKLEKTTGSLAETARGLSDAELTAMAGGLDSVAVASEGAAVATTGLSKAMLLLDAALPIIGAFATAYMIVEPLAEKFFQAQDDAALKAETLAAQQDKVNQAIRMGASPLIKYAEAIDFVNAAFARRDAQDPVKAAQAYLDKMSENARKAIDVAAAEEARTEGLARQGLVIGDAVDVERLMNKALEDQRQAHEKATREAQRFQEQLDRSTASAHKVEAGFAGLRTELGRVDTKDRDLAISTDKLKTKIDDVERSAYIAQFGFEGMTASLEKVGTHSTELDELRKHLKEIEKMDAWEGINHLDKALRQLAQSSDGAFGDVVKDIAHVVDALKTAHQAAEDFKNATTNSGKAAALVSGVAAVGSATGSGSAASKISGGALSGAMLGATIGTSVIPGLGTAAGFAIGAIAGGIVGLVRSLKNLEKAINPIRQKFIDSFRVVDINGVHEGLDVLNQKAHEAGVTLDHLLNAKNAQEYQAAVDELNVAFAKHEKLVNDAVEGTKLMHKALDTVSGDLKALHYVSPQLQANLDAVFDATTPEAYERAVQAVTEAIANQNAEAKALDDTLDRYKLTWEQLGETARTQHLGEIATGLLADFNRLRGAGVDVNLIYDKMGGSISDMVQAAKRSGTEIPSSLRDVVTEAARLGVLLDENGNKITDLTAFGVTFGTSFADNMAKVATSMDKVVDALNRIAAALGAVAAAPAIPSLPADSSPVGDVPVEPMASGGSGHATGPRLFFTRGNEDFAFSGEGKRFSGSGGATTVNVYVDGDLNSPAARRKVATTVRGEFDREYRTRRKVSAR